jgi:modulator of FtsH protease HflK
MAKFFGRTLPHGASLNDNKDGPWGGSDGPGGEGDGPRNPWSQPRKRKPGVGGAPSLDEFLKRSRERFGGHLPEGGRPFWLYGLGIFILLWIAFTSTHLIGPQERGVITRFGKYAGTLGPGMGLTFPAPIDQVQKVDVAQIRYADIGTSDPNDENLVLTGDENLIDMAYQVRWSIRDPEAYLFRIDDPQATISEVAQSAMRAVVADMTFNDAVGVGRAEIEQRVQTIMQQLLDRYGAGVTIEGVSIKQSDPPAAVTDAFKEVTAAQQQAQSAINNARAYSLQLIANAQGEATAFDKVYAQYKLAPEVTRRRLYYETMEQVLTNVDKTIVETPGVTPYLALPTVNKAPVARPAQ